MTSKNRLTIKNEFDDIGNPAGGHVEGMGLIVRWQNGPLGRPPKKTDGAFVEDLLEAAKTRLEFYQTARDGRFQCSHNAEAIYHIRQALLSMEARDADRDARKVEGRNLP